MARITKDYIINKTASKILGVFNITLPKILIFSPQRTFSNYFEIFLQINFFVNLKNSTNEVNNYDNKIHKHLFCPDINFLAKNYRDCIFIILFKNFHKWVESLKKNDQDFFDQFLVHHKINIKRYDVPSLNEYFVNWYKNWIKIKHRLDNVEFINHEQTFNLDNNQRIYNYLKKKYKLKSKGRIKIPEKIFRSEKFSIKDYKLPNKIELSELDNFFKII